MGGGGSFTAFGKNAMNQSAVMQKCKRPSPFSSSVCRLPVLVVDVLGQRKPPFGWKRAFFA
jgi:hypothetical protein